VVQTLQNAWVPHHPQAIPLLTATLILCADHELSTTTFTARCVASAGSSPYAVVLAGLATSPGMRYCAGYIEQIELLLQEIGSPGNVRPTLERYLKRGEGIHGFGHDLYPDGDPRGRLLLHLIATAYPASPALSLTVIENRREKRQPEAVRRNGKQRVSVATAQADVPMRRRISRTHRQPKRNRLLSRRSCRSKRSRCP
jgi:citrate synthase